MLKEPQQRQDTYKIWIFFKFLYCAVRFCEALTVSCLPVTM